MYILCHCFVFVLLFTYGIKPDYILYYLPLYAYNLYMAINAWNANNKKALNHCAEMKSTNLWCLHASFSTLIYIYIHILYKPAGNTFKAHKRRIIAYGYKPIWQWKRLNDGSNRFMSGNSDVLQIHKLLVRFLCASKTGALCYPDLICLFLPFRDSVVCRRIVSNLIFKLFGQYIWFKNLEMQLL